MLAKSAVPVAEVMTYLSDLEATYGLLVPTETAMEKSIIDATDNVRVMLKKAGLHDYDEQKQGTRYRRFIQVTLFGRKGICETKMSLYRPETKDGDPRVWIYALNGHATAHDLLILIPKGDRLVVINAAVPGYVPGLSIHRGLTPDDATAIAAEQLGALIAKSRRQLRAAAAELTAMLLKIGGVWHPAKSAFDTEVGRLLEDKLGLKANSKKTPDYKGIEVKSGRSRPGKTMASLFAEVPDWSISALKSSAEILDTFGYFRGDTKKLYCTVSSRGPNSQGLFLRLEEDRLNECSTLKTQPRVATWLLSKLGKRLLEKHPETVWVLAETENRSGREFIRYTEAEYTHSPRVDALPILLESGLITVDHLIKRPPGGTVKEKGPLFRMAKRDRSALFVPGEKYSLLRSSATSAA